MCSFSSRNTSNTLRGFLAKETKLYKTIKVFNYDRGEMESALVVGGDKGIVRIVSAGAECLRPQMPRIVPNKSV